MSNANFTQRFRMVEQFLREILRLGSRKIFIEGNDQQMSDAKRANQGDLVRSGRKQVRRFFRAEYFFRVRIKCHYHRRSIYGPSVFRRSRNDCLMPEMHPIKDADREKERTW